MTDHTPTRVDALLFRLDRGVRDLLPPLVFTVGLVGAVGWTIEHGFWPMGLTGALIAAGALWAWIQVRRES